MAQMLFKPVGSVTPPQSIGKYNGEPVSGFGGMMAPGRGMMGGGRGTMVAAPMPNLLPRERKAAVHRQELPGRWIIKDGENEIKLDLKIDGSKLTGTLVNPQMPEQSRLGTAK